MSAGVAALWKRVGTQVLPFADAATDELPLGRLLRLSLFQISVGIALVLLNGTLNRVMIVELGIPVWLVSVMVALPVLIAPARALIGFRSDHHLSALGWRRVPYIWLGTLAQFGGLAILPFALLVLSGRGAIQVPMLGEGAACLAFVLIGVGLHTTQTAGVSLATDLAPEDARPRVVALLYVMLLIGMVVASLAFGVALRDFGHVKLIQVIQGSALAVMVLNLVALWKQEPRRPSTKTAEAKAERPTFGETYRSLLRDSSTRRLLIAVGLGMAGFNMQDILLEPYGGEILKLSVSATTVLTAVMAAGTLLGLFIAARWLSRGAQATQLAALGALIGIVGFSAIIFSAPIGAPMLFRAGTALVGFGGGWFSVGTLTSAMALTDQGRSGVVIGAWGAVQATVAGAGIAFGGAMRDVLAVFAAQGALGPGLTQPWVGYSFVYHLEIALLFGALVAIGPLVRAGHRQPARFGLAEMPC
jgi:BCD family chlorophyll transporter-like MFS transporter